MTFIEIKISRKTLLVLNTSKTSVRLDNKPFPFQNKDEYIFDKNEIGGTAWETAVPKQAIDEVLEICLEKGIKPNKIIAIDTLEYRLSQHFAARDAWLFIPQEPGLRLTTLHEGAPRGCHFISNDPNFREKELERIGKFEAAVPKQAILYKCGADYDWLRSFMTKLGAETEEFSPDMEKLREICYAVPRERGSI